MSERRVAVVTGGTRGIGKAISLTLARSGCTVYSIYARNRQAAEQLAAEAEQENLAIHCLRADITDLDAVAACVERIKTDTDRVDILVHSAANGVHREAMKLTPKQINWTFNVNVAAVHNLIVRLVPMMSAGGRIVGITSSGATHPLPYYGAVGASKGALDALFRHYAAELAPQGIVVNLVCPGLVATEAIEAFPDKDELLRSTSSRTPTGRLTTPEDVAGVVHFVCTAAAAQIVGQTIVIDGGCALR